MAGRYHRAPTRRSRARADGSSDLYGLPVGATRRPAVLLARAGTLESASRAAMGCIHAFVHADRTRPFADYDCKRIARSRLYALDAWRAYRRLAQAAAVVSGLHGPVHSHSNVDIKLDEHAAFCARVVSHVRHVR